MSRSGDSSNLTAAQEKLVAALLETPTIASAAAAAGVSSRQAFRWLKEPAFGVALREARREALCQATGRLQATAGIAVAVLLHVAMSKTASPSARVTAAKALLDG